MEQCPNVYRKMLTAGISSVLVALGVDAADRDVLETLTEMIQCCKYILTNYCKIFIRFFLITIEFQFCVK